MKGLLTTLLCVAVFSASAQYAPQPDFKQAFKQHMLTTTKKQKPQLTFEQRDVMHHHIAGAILLVVASPVLASSIITLATGGENTNLAGTGLAFGGVAFGGSVALHTLGFYKQHKYRKAGKLPEK